MIIIILVCFIKLLDFLWSIMGWLIIGRSLTPMNFFEMEDSFRVYVCLIVLFLLISDLWGGILFMSGINFIIILIIISITIFVTISSLSYTDPWCRCR